MKPGKTDHFYKKDLWELEVLRSIGRDDIPQIGSFEYT